MTEPTVAVITRDTLAAFLAEFELAPSKKAGRAIVDFVCTALAGALRQGNVVHLKDFGRFEARDTPERPGRNPKTGEPCTITAHRRVKFKASKRLLAPPLPSGEGQWVREEPA